MVDHRDLLTQLALLLSTGPVKSVDDGTAIWGEPKKFPQQNQPGGPGGNFNNNQPRGNQSWGNEGETLLCGVRNEFPGLDLGQFAFHINLSHSLPSSHVRVRFSACCPHTRE